MQKKIYEKPEIDVVLLQQHYQLMAGSDLSKYDDPEDEINDPTKVW